MTTEIKHNIYQTCIDKIDDSDFADEIYGLVENIEQHYIDQSMIRTNNFRKIRNELNEKFDNEIKAMDNENIKLKEKIIEDKIIIKNLHIVRQYTNLIFNIKWNKTNEQIKKNTDFQDLANKTLEIKRKDIKDNNGIKYALLVINDICNDTKKDLAMFYICINDKYHPPIKPINEKVKQSLDELKRIINKHNEDINYNGIIINNKILNELEENVCLTKN
jgi:hypothetical protein